MSSEHAITLLPYFFIIPTEKKNAIHDDLSNDIIAIDHDWWLCEIERGQMATMKHEATRASVIVIALACICWCIIRKLNKPRLWPQIRKIDFRLAFSIYEFCPSYASEWSGDDGTSFYAIIKSTENNFLHYATENEVCVCVWLSSCSVLPFGCIYRSAICSASTQWTNGNKFLI